MSLLAFAAVAPFARLPLAPAPGFIPVYETAVIACDLVTAILLFGQFGILRSPAVLLLAAGYVFAAFMTVAHGLTFPGLFSTSGLLGAGVQSTAWLYMFWHGGFSLVVVAYSLLAGHGRERTKLVRPRIWVAVAVLAAVVTAGLLTMLSTAGETVLPVIMDGHRQARGMLAVVATVWALGLLALVALARAHRRTLLDLWLTVVMGAWLLDVAASALLNAARFDLGFYAGRAYGLMAAGFVLAVILVQTIRMYGRLAVSATQLTEYAGTLQGRVSEQSAALVARTRDLAYLFEQSPVAKWVFDDETLRFLAVNNAAIDSYGYTEDEFLSMRVTDIQLPENVERLTRMLRESTAPYRQAGDWRHRCKDGRIIDVEMFSHGLTFFDRRARMAVAIDVTPRKAAEAALRQNARLLEAAMDVAQLGSWSFHIIDATERTLTWSRECHRICGIAEDAFDHRRATFLQLVHPDDRAAVAEASRRAIDDGDPYRVTHRIVRPDGTIRWVAQRASVLRDAHGNPVEMIGIIQDITDARLVEEQLRQAQKMEAVGQLTGGLAHDFNNLLMVIMGNLEFLRDAIRDNAEADELAHTALEAARRGADLTRSLLAFARRQPLQPRTASINDLVGGMAALLSRTLGQRIEIVLDLSPEVWPVVVDPVQLESALANLATNARDAMPKGGRLTIGTSNRQLDADYASQHAEVTPGDYAAIEVSDTGSGMPAEVLAKVFEPFFTTKAPGRGTGLGLSMVFGFMKQSGGHVSVYSEVGVGTTFRLYLPRARDAADSSAARSLAAAPRGRGERVLVVEDNEALRRLALRGLGHLGYHAEGVASAEEALSLLEQGAPFDLVFTDIVMAGKVDGLDLARLVLERWPAIAIVTTSGFPGSEPNGHINPLPNVQLLGKPYLRDDLARAVRQALDARRAPDALGG